MRRGALDDDFPTPCPLPTGEGDKRRRGLRPLEPCIIRGFAPFPGFSPLDFPSLPLIPLLSAFAFSDTQAKAGYRTGSIESDARFLIHRRRR